MLDSRVIEALPIDQKREVKQALGTIALSQVIDKQISLMEETLLSGDADQSEVELAKEIVIHRRTVQQLQSFRQLCYSYLLEIK